MYNLAKVWMFLVGTKENAIRLRKRVDGLSSPVLDIAFGPEPRQCPLTVLYGAEISRKVYANPRLRPALDAWDTGAVSTNDLKRWCWEVENGSYTGPVFNASSLRGALPTFPISQEEI